MKSVKSWCVVVAAGSGSRFGGPKQLARLGDKRVLDHAVETARATCDGVVLVVNPDQRAEVEAGFSCSSGGLPIVVDGGTTRSASVRAGLRAVPPSAKYILVHDGARPLASTNLFGRVLDALAAGADAVVPAVPVVDTLRAVDGGVIDRSRLVAVQTPQGFRADLLRAAHAGGAEATDDAGLVEAAGGRVVLVDGEVHNRKITEPADLVVAAAFMGSRS